jgi:homocitrate synthase NifV
VRQAYGALGVALEDDQLTARLLARIRTHAMHAKQEPTPGDLQRFLRESHATLAPHTIPTAA